MRNKHDNQDQWDEQSPLGDQASFLNPDSAPSTPSMPDAVWANLERLSRLFRRPSRACQPAQPAAVIEQKKGGSSLK